MSPNIVTLILFFMRKGLIILVMALVAVVAGAKAPDFAYPDVVAREADEALAKALKAHDDVAAFKALVDMSLARSAVDTGTLPAMLVRIDSTAAVLDNPVSTAMLDLLKATILTDIYQFESYRYDQRHTPLYPYPANFDEWSGEQFRTRIDSLLMAAVDRREALSHVETTAWAPVLTLEDDAAKYFPTLADFVELRAMMIYDRLRESDKVKEIQELFIDRNKDRVATIVAMLTNVYNSDTIWFKNNDSDALVEIYKKYSDYESSLMALSKLSARREYYDLFKKATSDFPTSRYTPYLLSMMGKITCPEVYFRTPRYATPGVPLPVHIESTNAREIKLYIYCARASEMDDDDFEVDEERLKNPDIMRTILIDSVAPFSCDTTITITLPKAGQYFIGAISPEIDSDLEEMDLEQIECSNATIVVSSIDGEIYPYVVSSHTGAPLSGVPLWYSTGNDREYKYIGKTNKEGTLDSLLNMPDVWLQFKAVISAQDSTMSADVICSKDKFYKRLTGKVITSLSIYKPGDDVEWCSIAYESDNGDNTPLANAELIAILYDPSYNQIATDTLTTDESGRISGRFTLPEDIMGGRCCLSVKAGKDHIATGYFTVNDYRMPTFKATIDSIDIGIERVTAICRAVTYSGFPLPGARVAVNVTGNRYWWGYGGLTVAVDTLTTNEQGIASITLERDKLTAEKNLNFYTIECTVTSPGGENTNCRSSFTLGKPYKIAYNAPGSVDLSKPFDIKAIVKNTMEQMVDMELRYYITNTETGEKETWKKGMKITPGIYNITIEPVDTTLADRVEYRNITFYEVGKKFPGKSPVWIPVGTIKATTGKVAVKYGSAKKDAHILVIETVDGKIARRHFITPGGKMRELEVEVPDGSHELTVTFVSVYDGIARNKTVNIINTSTFPPLEIEVEHLVDKTVPGDRETITLKTTVDNTATESWIVMAMNAASLRQLAPYYFRFDAIDKHYSKVEIETDNESIYDWIRNDCKVDTDLRPKFPKATFNLYSMSWTTNHGVMMRKYNSISIRGMNSTAAYDEVVVTGYATRATMTGSVSAESSEEAASLDEVVSVEADDADSEAAAGEVEEVQARPVEEPLAFFAPMLTATDGTLSYTYEVPQANTEWLLDILAYDASMRSAFVERSVIASRPVMVQTTLPRFMRTGDVTTLRSTVMNNTDSTQTVTVTVSLGDIASLAETVEIAPRATANVDLAFTVPDRAEALIYNVKAVAGRYSDAVVAPLPILPAAQPVVESQPFYIPADSTRFDVELPAREGTSNLTLCSNPLWQAVTALQDGSNDYVTSIGMSQFIVEAYTSMAILDAHPDFRKVIGSLDGTTRGNLSRDDSLKIASINLTPWMMTALNEDQRLQLLARSMTDKQLCANIDRAVRGLESTLCSDGSFSWLPGFSRGSLWATTQVVKNLGALKRAGRMGDNKKLEEMFGGAVAYLDRMALEQYKKDRKGVFYDYVVARQALPGYPIPASCRPLVTNTVNEILRIWSRQSVELNARFAKILYYNGYPAVARRVVASILAHSLYTPERGRYWQRLDSDGQASILEAINLVTPSDTRAREEVAQWMLLDKLNRSWGNTATVKVNALVDALPATSVAPAAAPVVTVDGKPLQLDSSFPGTTGASLTDAAGTLSIEKNSPLPAYGGVVSRYIMPVDSVKAIGHPWLRVDARYVADSRLVNTLPTGNQAARQLVLNVEQGVDYVVVSMPRPAGMEPAEQISGYFIGDSRLYIYREVTDTETRLYITSLPAGTYIIDIPEYALSAGDYAVPAVTVQSQYNPTVTATSAGSRIVIK